MDGLVLNFDAGEDVGLIRAGDGKRYSFQGSDWKSASPPRISDVVDFEVEEGRAAEIYLVRSDAPVAAPDPQASIPRTAVEIPPAPPEAAYAFRGNVAALAFGALIPLSFFLPWISGSGLSLNYWDMLSGISLADFLPGRSPDPTLFPKWPWIFTLLTYLMCAAPACAVWLIIQELRGASTPKLREGVGWICLQFALIFLLAMWQALATLAPAMQWDSRVNFFSVLSAFGIGWILLILLSVGLIAVGRGWPPFPRREDAELETSPATYGPFDSGTIEPAPDESWVYLREEPASFFDNSANLTHAGRGAALGALLCFMLPWLSIWRPEYRMGSVSGASLILGGRGTEHVLTQPSLTALLAAILIFASILLSFVFANRKLKWTFWIGCGGAVLLLLYEVLAHLSPSAPIQTAPQVGFWLTILALVIAMIAGWRIGRIGEEID